MPEEVRVALMSPDAVEDALVYSGEIHYTNIHDQVVSPTIRAVEVGKWKAQGQEMYPADYLCTYYAAIALGYVPKWLHAANGDFKYLIFNGRDENGEAVSLTTEEAEQIQSRINEVFQTTKRLRS